ncbi:hypothetical protein [Roseofilum casamattae]|uniref:Uncharacterized protein n=1 Tax=Roseofilum casamattae BLCC-M143 TaxID=3022442 RepID=A0ABT7C1P7_9CYAN|nr:hypothetical protein [Roseofilum casamattae]MDJ1184684.1 hypothetical protein [Roseofilum casamattae BLCC-M143]
MTLSTSPQDARQLALSFLEQEGLKLRSQETGGSFVLASLE